MDFTIFFTTASLISIFTLTLLEIVLGVDNIIFISIITDKLPKKQQKNARNLGLMIAMGIRIVLLLGIGWVISLDKETIDIFPQFVKDWSKEAHPGHVPSLLSVKELILLGGGLFLMYKSVTEIHDKVVGSEHATKSSEKSYTSVILQCVLINLIFSVDSILTAIGIVKVGTIEQNVPVMMAGVILSMLAMLLFAGKISDFISKRPTIKMLALSFLVMIGFVLVCEAFNFEFPKSLLYFAMAFSFLVEMFNLKMRKNLGKAEH